MYSSIKYPALSRYIIKLGSFSRLPCGLGLVATAASTPVEEVNLLLRGYINPARFCLFASVFSCFSCRHDPLRVLR